MIASTIAPINLHQSQVHPVLTRKSHVIRGLNAAESYRCFRCHRDLPESEFQPINATKSALYLHPLCFLCRRQIRAGFDREPLYSPALHRAAKRAIERGRGGAKSRGIVFAIDADDVLEMFFAQKGLCALSGVKMTIMAGTRGAPAWTAFSIDRIHCNRNYTRDNCHLVCAVVNLMRRDLDCDQFLKWCARIAINSAKRAP